MTSIRAKQWRVTIAIALLFPPLNALAATEFYVSPGGNDTHPGTRRAPFASIGRAQAAVRALSTRTEPIHVYLSGGIYYPPQTLVFEADDSGTSQAPITYMAVSGEEPLLSGGLRCKV